MVLFMPYPDMMSHRGLERKLNLNFNFAREPPSLELPSRLKRQRLLPSDPWTSSQALDAIDFSSSGDTGQGVLHRIGEMPGDAKLREARAMFAGGLAWGQAWEVASFNFPVPVPAALEVGGGAPSSQCPRGSELERYNRRKPALPSPPNGAIAVPLAPGDSCRLPRPSGSGLLCGLQTCTRACETGCNCCTDIDHCTDIVPFLDLKGAWSVSSQQSSGHRKCLHDLVCQGGHLADLRRLHGLQLIDSLLLLLLLSLLL
ncbi:unnamed protein product [Polarella glacialis]|uniref:Uncharacterized protein n=1 Tax=Polarella glacialis TaxID=89957 RepID=A0A813H2Z2_POLGL|nr:unnamed protein product [Polarella glacialis]